MTATLLSEERLSDGKLARITLRAGKGNVLTRAVCAELTAVFEALGADGRVRAVVLGAEGPHFSFGASVEEHRPGEVTRMLPAFHALMRATARAALPLVVAVRGKCLGGGLELAILASHLVVAEDAELGVPEVKLGVFPPVAAAVLPLRVRQPVVDRMVGSGESLRGAAAVAAGLADEVAPAADVDARALAFAERYLPLSGAAVRFATRAARSTWNDALTGRLESLERLYLDELMSTEDAREGITAFLEKRAPAWRDR